VNSVRPLRRDKAEMSLPPADQAWNLNLSMLGHTVKKRESSITW
jgi:hypothetical protein